MHACEIAHISDTHKTFVACNLIDDNNICRTLGSAQGNSFYPLEEEKEILSMKLLPVAVTDV